MFLLIVPGWCIPGISGCPTWTPPPSITCGTVQVFFDFFLHLYIIFVSARFFNCFLTLELLPSILASASTIVNIFANFASCLCSKLNFLQDEANFPPVHYLRNGPALAFLDFFLRHFFLYLSPSFIIPEVPVANLNLAHHEVSSGQQRTALASSAAQRRAVSCSAVLCRVPCRAVRSVRAVRCCAVLRDLLYFFVSVVSTFQVPAEFSLAHQLSSAQLSSAQLSSAAPCGAMPCRAVWCFAVLSVLRRAALLSLLVCVQYMPGIIRPFLFSCMMYHTTILQGATPAAWTAAGRSAG